MLNIREIAKIAGVGKSTVSRVINQTGYVSDETRKKIEAVMQEYEYSPSAASAEFTIKGVNVHPGEAKDIIPSMAASAAIALSKGCFS